MTPRLRTLGLALALVIGAASLALADGWARSGGTAVPEAGGTVTDLYLDGDEARITAADLGTAVARVRAALATSTHATARAGIIQIHASAL